jgi:hypothetical protein
VLDHDTYSSHDAIGKIYIDLKPLLSTNGPTSINGKKINDRSFCLLDFCKEK